MSFTFLHKSIITHSKTKNTLIKAYESKNKSKFPLYFPKLKLFKYSRRISSTVYEKEPYEKKYAFSKNKYFFKKHIYFFKNIYTFSKNICFFKRIYLRKNIYFFVRLLLEHGVYEKVPCAHACARLSRLSFRALLTSG